MGGTGGANSSAPNRGRIGALLGVVEEGAGGSGALPDLQNPFCQAMSTKIVFLAFSRHFQAPFTFWRRQNLVPSRFQTLFQAPQMELFWPVTRPSPAPQNGFYLAFCQAPSSSAFRARTGRKTK